MKGYRRCKTPSHIFKLVIPKPVAPSLNSCIQICMCVCVYVSLSRPLSTSVTAFASHNSSLPPVCRYSMHWQRLTAQGRPSEESGDDCSAKKEEQKVCVCVCVHTNLSLSRSLSLSLSFSLSRDLCFQNDTQHNARVLGRILRFCSFRLKSNA